MLKKEGVMDNSIYFRVYNTKKERLVKFFIVRP